MAEAVHTSSNGKLPAAALAATPGGQPLVVAATEALARVSAACAAAGKRALSLSPGLSGYRTLAEQRHMIDIHLTTVAVGTSIHGEGLAADIAGLGGWKGDRHKWLVANGATYGWYQPGWTSENHLDEPWHWEYDPELDQLHEEDDMPYSRQELKQIIAETLRENLGDQPSRVSWGPASLAKWATKGGAALLRSPADLQPLVEFFDPHMRNVVREETTKVVRVETGPSQLAAALSALLERGGTGLTTAELDRLHAAVEHAQTQP